MRRTLFLIIILALASGCAGKKSKTKTSAADIKILQGQKYAATAQRFNGCQQQSLEKNLAGSSDTSTLREAVLADCKKELSSYWMATMLKYRIKTDFKKFEQQYLESLEQTITEAMARKNSSQAISK